MKFEMSEESESLTLPAIPQSFNSVKIKQEKLTPPSSPKRKATTSSLIQFANVKKENCSNKHTLGESVFSTLLPPNDDKKTVELTKSSEELLAELFHEKEKGKKRKLEDTTKSTSKHKKKKIEKSEVRKDDLDIDEYEKQLLDFKNSAVYEEKVNQAEEKKKEHRYDKYDDTASESGQSKSSEISLSDEETYERNRARFYERDSYYGGRSTDRYRDRSPKHRSRDRYESSYFGHGHRGLGCRYEDRDRDRRRRRSRSRSQHSEERIDKKRLLEIARKNAISMLKNGTLPGTQNMAPEAKEKVLAKMRFGGKSVDELTEFCKKLSNGESNGFLSDVSDDSDHDEDGNEKPFNHPFMLKERNEPIVMNIKNSTPIQPKTAEQTKAILMQFPVSSGQHHRLNESEWVPVPPKKPAPKAKTEKTIKSIPVAIMPPPPAPEPVPKPEVNIFPDSKTSNNLDVTTIITKRLNAMRKLQENPMDQEAIKLMYNTQKEMSAWADSKFIPGQFTGSTGANILSAKELTSGFQAWAKRDQLLTTTPVSGGMGMHLLKKMGWNPGEGLGKEKNGSLQPLLLEVKLDKKGLVANEDVRNMILVSEICFSFGHIEQNSGASSQQPKRRKPTNITQAVQSMESKHPVSLLGEMSAKRKWQMPKYDLVCETGPHHNRQFLFTVEMNGIVYRPPTASNNKKEAKAVAAKFALQQMGVLQ
ncbi:Protein Son [Pseudolycoriella hygida]|uniref:Protein Son n=1 Tax=Pseudolycoriella hygida TaxID=35572 RepID=A0A9Q0NCZ3_9DIPT|nr:Protein Son [Pseudolycoriella hygida]